ncbi:MAG: RNA-binding S4 domain-containing protein [Bacteroidales bacterium]|nr:RNA-binding S4 domain-containing protein [Bacteroidales bacterium]
MSTGTDNIRIDKFLWAVRLFKTRSSASEACRKGKVFVNDIQVKPSRNVIPGDTITLRKMPVVYTYKVIEPIENRVSAKIVARFIDDLTPEEEKNKLLATRMPGAFGARERGTGRPTKKERRIIDNMFDDLQVR